MAAFEWCSGLTSITIPNSVMSIGSGAFYYCLCLKSITIPCSVTSIGSCAFSGCSSLNKFINCATTPQTIGADVFEEMDQASCTLFVPASSISAYQSATGWMDFGDIVSGACDDGPISTIRIKYSYDETGNRKTREKSIEMRSMLKSSIGKSNLAVSDIQMYEDVISEMKIFIYPNPTQGMLKVDITGGEIPKDARIYLYNLQGALIRQLTGISETNEVDISSQPSGIYLMKIIFGKDQFSTWKIIKD